MRDHFVVTLEGDDVKPELFTRAMRAIEQAAGAVLKVAFRSGDPKVTCRTHWLEDPARADDPPAGTEIEISPEGRRMYAAVDALYTGTALPRLADGQVWELIETGQLDRDQDVHIAMMRNLLADYGLQPQEEST